MTQTKLPLALLCAVLMAACATSRDDMASSDHYGKYEAPPHETLERDGAFEVRRYEPYVVAKTTVEADSLDKASREGFRRLAGYIFGGNQGSREISMTVPVTAEPLQARERSGERIAMTSPVAAEPSGEGWDITFMMPRSYDLETLSIPNDDRVTFERVEPRCRAVVRFSWLATDGRVDKQTEALRSWAQGHGLTLSGAPVIARYDDPLTLPWRRTNEIWFDVAEGDCPDEARG